MEPPQNRPHPSDGGRPLVEEPAALARSRARLLAFFDTRARDLPWRRTSDPYAIWVSEVMLQQTRVDTVLPYYQRWLRRYPTAGALAEAPLQAVLKDWEGLGYYRRARLLHRAARIVRDRHGGRLPSDPDALRDLPGVGEYTAGAVASIAFQHVVPAVDGNVRRVLSRVMDLPDPTPGELRKVAAALVDPDRPGDFNQALMELGATVCTPRSPDCADCPLRQPCRARARGVQEERPAPRQRGPVPERRYGVAVAVHENGGAWWCVLAQRPPEGLLGGMWQFPSRRIEGEEERPEAAPEVASARAVPVAVEGAGAALPLVEHAYSHFRGVYHAFVFRTSNGSLRSGVEGLAGPARWVPLADLGGLPVPVAQQRIAAAARALLAKG